MIKPEKILNSLNAIIIGVDNQGINYCNHGFLNFFGVKNIEEFNARKRELMLYFLNRKTSLDKFQNSLFEWAKNVSKQPHKNRIVRMQDKSGYIKIFILDIAKVDKENLVLILTDVTKIQKEKDKLNTFANIDALTKISNRRFAESELKRLYKAKEPMFVAIFDLDKFKRINDEYGHETGDVVLKKVAKIAAKNIRHDDILARWGGEEFMLILRTDSKEYALTVCERIRVAFDSFKDSEIPHFTASFGVSKVEPEIGLNKSVQKADENMYKAKQNGRNLVVLE